jgi:hypothetical protein
MRFDNLMSATFASAFKLLNELINLEGSKPI